MARLRVNSFSISLDGYGAGPDQRPRQPARRRRGGTTRWMRPTRTFRQMFGRRRRHDRCRRRVRGARVRQHRRVDPRPQHVRADPGPVARRRLEGLVGREPAVPRAGLRADASPARLDHDGRRHGLPLRDDGIHAALARATEAANGRDIRLGGGVATIRQYLRARLVDEMHLAISPVLLGSGEHLFAGVDCVDARLQVHRARGNAQCHPHRPQQVTVAEGS